MTLHEGREGRLVLPGDERFDESAVGRLRPLAQVEQVVHAAKETGDLSADHDEVDVAGRCIRPDVPAQLDATEPWHGPVAYHDVRSVVEDGIPCSGTVLDEANPQKNPYQFTAQANHFSNCVQNNLEPKTPGEEGLRDLRCITEIYRTAGISML